MAVNGNNGIKGSGFDFLLQSLGKRKPASPAAGGVDFAATLQASLGDFKSQALGTVLGAAGASAPTGLAALLAQVGATSATQEIKAAGGLSPTGRNLALFDPESAYRMMTEINRREVTYKAEFAELGDLGKAVATMQKEATTLAGIDAGSSNAEIVSRLQTFVQAYNGWIDRFDETLADGGLLAGTQAAKVAQRALEQGIQNPFHGARAGLRGMDALGVSIDPVTNLASLDVGRLNDVLAGNRQGVINTIDEFGAQFARSAELLNAPNNFISNRLNNLSRVVDFIKDNMASLQAEFGTGDAPRPGEQLARGLAAYQAQAKRTAA